MAVEYVASLVPVKVGNSDLKPVLISLASMQWAESEIFELVNSASAIACQTVSQLLLLPTVATKC